jgi:hypothetical protein
MKIAYLNYDDWCENLEFVQQWKTYKFCTGCKPHNHFLIVRSPVDPNISHNLEIRSVIKQHAELKLNTSYLDTRYGVHIFMFDNKADAARSKQALKKNIVSNEKPC